MRFSGMNKMLLLVLLGLGLSCTHDARVQGKTELLTLAEDSIVPIAQRYQQLNDSVLEMRKHWRQELAKGVSAKVIRKNAQKAFVQLIYQSYFTYWDGTPWAFYGTSTTPQSGTIACGYFVTTVLQHMGVKIDRVAMAKTYSENLIKTMVRPSYIKKFVPFKLPAFVAEIERGEDAVYLTGLDNHVGFVVVKNHKAYFIHSSVISPGCVVREAAMESPALQMNYYTVVGNFTADDKAMDKWIANQ